MRAVAATAIGAGALVAVCVGVAHATGGGGSIASAPVVAPGVQQLGNTSSFTDTCQNGYEFWMLHLKQGDLVKVTWGTPPTVDTLALWPAGTSDSANNTCLYNSGWSSWSVSPVLSDSNGTPATNRLSQATVTADGDYPLLFLHTTGGNSAGSYSFTATVLHAASVFLPQTSSIPENGKLTAAVLAPDNSPITDPTLALTLRAYWSLVPGAPPSPHRLATATPKNGTATFRYTLPARFEDKTIAIDIVGQSSTYQPVKSAKESVKVLRSATGPILMSLAELKVESKLLGQPIYWAGRRRGFRYEFTRTLGGYVYVRYLPRGVPAGAHSPKYLIVATYPFRNAYAGLKAYAKGKAVAGPNGSIYFARPNDPRSVYVAFPGVDYEIEVYHPRSAVARAIASSGSVRPIP